MYRGEIDDQEHLLAHKDGVARIKTAQLLQRVIAWNFAGWSRIQSTAILGILH
jgi:hypothetical protein